MLSKHNAAASKSIFIIEVCIPTQDQILQNMLCYPFTRTRELNLNVLYSQKNHELSCCSELL